jgi:hypothetical protein
MDDYEQKAVNDIEEFGCHVLHVLEEDDLSCFTYSIGISRKTGRPDLVITGLNREIAHWVINEYNERLRNGEQFEVDNYYSGFLEGFEVTFKEVSKEHYKEHFGWGLWYYGNMTFPVLQLVFPSTSGDWPWDQEASQDFKWIQPILSAR